MGNDILMLDSLAEQRRVEDMSTSLGRKITLVETIEQASLELTSNRDRYAVLTVELLPFSYSETDEEPLLTFLKETRTEYSLPVIVYSSRKESLVQRLGLEKGVHYDGYAPKVGGAETLKKIIDSLFV